MRMLVLSLKAITSPIHSQCHPTGHVISRKVNIFSPKIQAEFRSEFSLAVNREDRREESRELQSRETTEPRSCESTRTELQEAKQQSYEVRRQVDSSE